jgi:hypothetical protein
LSTHAQSRFVYPLSSAFDGGIAALSDDCDVISLESSDASSLTHSFTVAHSASGRVEQLSTLLTHRSESVACSSSRHRALSTSDNEFSLFPSQQPPRISTSQHSMSPPNFSQPPLTLSIHQKRAMFSPFSHQTTSSQPKVVSLLARLTADGEHQDRANRLTSESTTLLTKQSTDLFHSVIAPVSENDSKIGPGAGVDQPASPCAHSRSSSLQSLDDNMNVADQEMLSFPAEINCVIKPDEVTEPGLSLCEVSIDNNPHVGCIETKVRSVNCTTVKRGDLNFSQSTDSDKHGDAERHHSMPACLLDCFDEDETERQSSPHVTLPLASDLNSATVVVSNTPNKRTSRSKRKLKSPESLSPIRPVNQDVGTQLEECEVNVALVSPNPTATAEPEEGNRPPLHPTTSVRRRRVSLSPSVSSSTYSPVTSATTRLLESSVVTNDSPTVATETDVPTIASVISLGAEGHRIPRRTRTASATASRDAFLGSWPSRKQSAASGDWRI